MSHRRSLNLRPPREISSSLFSFLYFDSRSGHKTCFRSVVFIISFLFSRYVRKSREKGIGGMISLSLFSFWFILSLSKNAVFYYWLCHFGVFLFGEFVFYFPFVWYWLIWFIYGYKTMLQNLDVYLSYLSRFLHKILWKIIEWASTKSKKVCLYRNWRELKMKTFA